MTKSNALREMEQAMDALPLWRRLEVIEALDRRVWRQFGEAPVEDTMSPTRKAWIRGLHPPLREAFQGAIDQLVVEEEVTE